MPLASVSAPAVAQEGQEAAEGRPPGANHLGGSAGAATGTSVGLGCTAGTDWLPR
jgi:hypothetical protein